uniref:hypothetical protein n=1 Tax=Prevotella sp. TaxID=59823 RepID=UPI003FEE9983
RRSSVPLDNTKQVCHYALGFAAYFGRIMNYELLGWCCRAGRSTSYIILNQSVYSFTSKQSFLLFYSFTPLLLTSPFYFFTLLFFLLLKQALFGLKTSLVWTAKKPCL